MFKKESDKKSFTARDIDRYHNGLMLPAERNALERAALEDPFLEEAMEGYAGRPAGSIPDDLEELRSRLGRRVKGDDRRSLLLVGSWWKVAAIVVFMVGAGSLLYRGLQKEAPEHQALAVQERKVAPSRETQVAPGKEAAKLEAAKPEGAKPEVAKPEGAATLARTLKKKAALPDRTFVARDSIVMQIPPVQAEPANAPQQQDLAAALSGKVSGVVVSSRVTDINHQPVPFATVKVLPSGNSVSADANGYFAIKAVDSTSKVSVSAVGFDNKQYFAYQLADSSSLTLHERSNGLNEVVVVGYGSRKRTRYLAHPYHADSDSTAVQPIEGWSAYGDYLIQNIQLPDEALRNHIHGEVTLSFRVDGTGNPVNISVEKSLCASCDAEAVRLVKEGPQWKKVSHKNKVKGLVRVHF